MLKKLVNTPSVWLNYSLNCQSWLQSLQKLYFGMWSFYFKKFGSEVTFFWTELYQSCNTCTLSKMKLRYFEWDERFVTDGGNQILSSKGHLTTKTNAVIKKIQNVNRNKNAIPGQVFLQQTKLSLVVSGEEPLFLGTGIVLDLLFQLIFPTAQQQSFEPAVNSWKMWWKQIFCLPSGILRMAYRSKSFQATANWDWFR